MNDEMKNKQIKDALKKKGLRQWQLAEKLNVNESVLSRRLRKELPPEEKEQILKVIEEETGIEKALNEVLGWIPITERLPEVRKDPYDKISYSDYILISFANCPLPSIGRYEQYQDGSGAFFDGDEPKPLSKHGFIVNGWMALPRCMED